MATAGCSGTFIDIYQTTRCHIARTCQLVICSTESHRKGNTLVPQKFEYCKDKYLYQLLNCIICIVWCIEDLGKDSFLHDIRKLDFLVFRIKSQGLGFPKDFHSCLLPEVVLTKPYKVWCPVSLYPSTSTKITSDVVRAHIVQQCCPVLNQYYTKWEELAFQMNISYMCF